MYRRVKTVYNAEGKSVPVPIIAHSNEVVLPVKTCKKLYPILKSDKPLPDDLRKELKALFETTQIPI